MTRIEAAIATFLVLPLLALAAHAEEPVNPDAKQGAVAESQDESAKDEKPRGDNCIFSRTVDDFEIIDNRTLVVYAPTRKAPYIVELFFPEPGLKFEHTLGFQDRNADGRICAYGGDAILVQGPISNRITISSISRVDPEQVKQLKVAAQEKKSTAKTTMPAQEDMKSDKAGAQQPAQKPAEDEPAEPKN
jgi:hypothetical protein